MKHTSSISEVRPLRPRWVAAAVAVWAVTAVVGAGSLWRYALVPGPAAHAAIALPADSRLPQAPGQAMLIMTLHPQCPCSRASLSELETLLARCGRSLTTYVVFAQPDGLKEKLEDSDLWQTAQRIPGVIVQRDATGDLTRSLGAETSGQVFVYDAAGSLKFSGGITESRGHAGVNTGRLAIEAILHARPAEASSTPVFGCALW